jgi:hypothetical protein
MRHLTPRATPEIQTLLDGLLDLTADVESYRHIMYAIGVLLARDLIDMLQPTGKEALRLAFTVEDADFLVAGALDALEKTKAFREINLACFWNEHSEPFSLEQYRTAPVIKKYLEPATSEPTFLVVVKSIIRGTCVVKTNLTHLIESTIPERIIIAAPVILEGAEARLNREFPPSMHEKFEYCYYAADTEKDETGTVIPGVGGNIYVRLGFADEDDKNRYTPKLVKLRRKQFEALSA